MRIVIDMQINTDYIKKALLERTQKPFFPYSSLQEFIDSFKDEYDSINQEYPCPNCNGTGTIHNSYYDEYESCHECDEGEVTLQYYEYLYDRRKENYLKNLEFYNIYINSIDSIINKLSPEDLLTIYNLIHSPKLPIRKTHE